MTTIEIENEAMAAPDVERDFVAEGMDLVVAYAKVYDRLVPYRRRMAQRNLDEREHVEHQALIQELDVVKASMAALFDSTPGDRAEQIVRDVLDAIDARMVADRTALYRAAQFAGGMSGGDAGPHPVTVAGADGFRYAFNHVLGFLHSAKMRAVRERQAAVAAARWADLPPVDKAERAVSAAEKARSALVAELAGIGAALDAAWEAGDGPRVVELEDRRRVLPRLLEVAEDAHDRVIEQHLLAQAAAVDGEERRALVAEADAVLNRREDRATRRRRRADAQAAIAGSGS